MIKVQQITHLYGLSWDAAVPDHCCPHHSCQGLQTRINHDSSPWNNAQCLTKQAISAKKDFRKWQRRDCPLNERRTRPEDIVDSWYCGVLKTLYNLHYPFHPENPWLSQPLRAPARQTRPPSLERPGLIPRWSKIWTTMSLLEHSRKSIKLLSKISKHSSAITP